MTPTAPDLSPEHDARPRGLLRRLASIGATPRRPGAPENRSSLASRVARSWLGEPQLGIGVDCFLLVLALVAVVIGLAAEGSVASMVVVLLAACLIPGGALLTRLGADDIVEAFTLAAALGFCIETAGALVMVWTGWWHPVGWAFALLAGACVLIVLDLHRLIAAVKQVV